MPVVENTVQGALSISKLKASSVLAVVIIYESLPLKEDTERC